MWLTKYRSDIGGVHAEDYECGFVVVETRRHKVAAQGRRATGGKTRQTANVE
jgi:hypothetical protein